MLLARFKNQLKKLVGDDYKSRLYIVGCSGGVDSVVLTHLLYRAKLSAVMAHVNYNLRGRDSQLDALHVQKLATQWNLPCYIHSVDLKSTLHKGESLQNVARQIRYVFFKNIMAAHESGAILTAHHAQDNLETVLMQLIKGVTPLGMPEINHHILRPMLTFDKQMIMTYAKKYRLTWREDASNATDDYLRNQIRHHVVPELYRIHKNMELQAVKSLDLARTLKSVYDESILKFQTNSVKETETGWYIDRHALQHFPGRIGVIQNLTGKYIPASELVKLLNITDVNRQVEFNRVSILFTQHAVEIILKKGY